MKATILGGHKLPKKSPFFKLTEELITELAKENYVIVTGGGSGIMRAASAKGKALGLKTVAITIDTFRHEYVPGTHDKTIWAKSLAQRKLQLFSSDKIFIFPGGLGTLDEIVNILLQQELQLIPQKKIVLFGKSYWKPLIKLFEKMTEEKLLITTVLDKFLLVDSIKEMHKLTK